MSELIMKINSTYKDNITVEQFNRSLDMSCLRSAVEAMQKPMAEAKMKVPKRTGELCESIHIEHKTGKNNVTVTLSSYNYRHTGEDNAFTGTEGTAGLDTKNTWSGDDMGKERKEDTYYGSGEKSYMSSSFRPNEVFENIYRLMKEELF